MRMAWGVVLLMACGEEPAPTCPSLPVDCSPQYTPDFDAVFSNTLATSCGVGGNSCHAGPTPQAGLGLEDSASAYQGLLDGGLVVPGDPACSPLVQRLRHEDPGFLMPPGMRLSDGEICAVRRWIEAGAKP
jgi:hypothetical protein